MDLSARKIFLGIAVVICFNTVSGSLTWEDVPPMDDPCTMILYGLNDTFINAYHPDPKCLNGGFVWYRNKARLHLHFFLNSKKDQDFVICLEGGLLDSVYIFWDSHDDYWSPIGFPNWANHMYSREICRPSTDGVSDLIFEPPWNVPSYVSWVRWSIKPVDDLDAATEWPEDDAWDELMKEVGDDNFKRDDDQEYY